MAFNPFYPQVGALYHNPVRSGVLVWSQAALGALVYPQQPQGEHSALYTAGCGHWFNCPSVYEQYDVIAKSSAAIICCPMCSFIFQIIRPYSNYSSYVDTPLVTG